MINLEKIRERTIKNFKMKGIIGFEILPLLSGDEILVREKSEIIDRSLILYILTAISHGFELKNGVQWLKREKIFNKLSPLELDFLDHQGDKKLIANQKFNVEALFALSQVMGLHDEDILFSSVPNNLVFNFPDIRKGENSRKFKDKVNLISNLEIVKLTDSLYCYHWYQREMYLNERGGTAQAEKSFSLRRKALEWVMNSKLDWDNVPLDT